MVNDWPPIGAGLSDHIVDQEDLYLLHTSPLFDPNWYSRTYRDITPIGLEPAIHYLKFGARLGRAPSVVFDPKAYLRDNRDVAQSGHQALLHFLRTGRREGRAITPVARFDSCELASWLGLSAQAGAPAKCNRRRIEGPGVWSLARGLEHGQPDEPGPASLTPTRGPLRRLLVIGWDLSHQTGRQREYAKLLSRWGGRSGLDVTSVELTPYAPARFITPLVRAYDRILVCGLATLIVTPQLARALSDPQAGGHLVHISESRETVDLLLKRHALGDLFKTDFEPLSLLARPGVDEKLTEHRWPADRLRVEALSAEEALALLLNEDLPVRSAAPSAPRSWVFLSDATDCEAHIGTLRAAAGLGQVQGVVPDTPANRRLASSLGEGGVLNLELDTNAEALRRSAMSILEQARDGVVILAGGATPGLVDMVSLNRASAWLEANVGTCAVRLAGVPAWSLATRDAVLLALGACAGAANVAECIGSLLASRVVPEIDNYGFASCQHLAGAHRGEDIYVIASGASIDHFDPGFFEGKTVISVNRAFERIPSNYAVLKEHPGKLIESRADENSVIVCVARGEAGDLGRGSRLENSVFFNAARALVFDHPPNTLGPIDLSPIRDDDGRLVVSRSTVTSALHLAARMGAANILLVGHDCGLLDGQVNYAGYYNEEIAPRQGSDAKYAAWLKEIEGETLRVKKALETTYGCRTYSINPFVNFFLEGHRFEHLSQNK